MAIDISAITSVDAEPGELPDKMTAWVIREEREGEPIDAFQLEEVDTPEPAAFEVVVRVMAAGVNFNNVWAALGKPISIFKSGDHPEFGHHIGGSDASGIVWKVGPGVTRWKPGDEVVVHCNQASYEDVEVHGLDPMAAPSQKIWGYETTWGSFAQFTKVQAQQLLPKPAALSWEEAASYGLTYFTAYRMLLDRAKLQSGHRVLIWGAAHAAGFVFCQVRVMDAAPDAPGFAGSLNISSANIGIALGSLVGGKAIEFGGVANAAAAGTLLAVLAAAAAMTCRTGNVTQPSSYRNQSDTDIARE